MFRRHQKIGHCIWKSVMSLILQKMGMRLVIYWCMEKPYSLWRTKQVQMLIARKFESHVHKWIFWNQFWSWPESLTPRVSPLLDGQTWDWLGRSTLQHTSGGRCHIVHISQCCMQPLFLCPSPPLDNIRVLVIVWRLRGNIVRTALCWIVWHNVHSQQTLMWAVLTGSTDWACHIWTITLCVEAVGLPRVVLL